jgi:hypothetical protein
MKADATGITSSIAGSRSSLRGNLRRFIGGFVKDWTRCMSGVTTIHLSPRSSLAGRRRLA